MIAKFCRLDKTLIEVATVLLESDSRLSDFNNNLIPDCPNFNNNLIPDCLTSIII